MFLFRDLDEKTRGLMLLEVEHDRHAVSEFYGRRLTVDGVAQWSGLLGAAIASGDADSLALALTRGGLLKTHEEATAPKTGKAYLRKVPSTAAAILAQGEFNRFYIRALCRRSMEEGSGVVQVYRARHSENPRPESEALLGEEIDAKSLLEDLRAHPGAETLLGVPLVNSGLSVTLSGTMVTGGD
jgi:hypothetical protein